MARHRILVVEDRDALRRMLERALAQEGYSVETAATGDEGVRLATESAFDLVLTDLRLPGASGLDVLRASRAAWPQVPVVVLTAYGTVDAAVAAMKLGAVDFLEKPVEIDDLFDLVAAQLGERPGGPASEVGEGGPIIVGSHPRLRASLRLLKQVAATDSTVLLTGESGTGKELFAEALHALSNRRGGPFVAVNCAAIPETLLENELFGHEKGSFTGAHRRQIGRIEAAEGGTLLLDEIGELNAATQAKILRVIETHTFERVGGERLLTADIRLTAATNRDLAAMVDEGAFRSDLFYRLDVFPIELPPLRERATDIPALALHLIAGIAERLQRPAPRIDPRGLALLEGREWPGNVRQLANVLERALIMLEGPRLTAADLEPMMAPEVGGDEGDRVREALRQSAGDRKLAAESLGISYRTLLRRIREYDLGGFPEYRD